jgi:hypothetical protein
MHASRATSFKSLAAFASMRFKLWTTDALEIRARHQAPHVSAHPGSSTRRAEVFMQAHAEFRDSLKLANPVRFALINPVILSRLPDGHALSDHHAIGIYYLDKENLRNGVLPYFKQDFIVRRADGTLVSYTAPGLAKIAGSPHVKPIADFEAPYGDGGKYYTRPGHPKPLVHHHDDVSDLPPELQANAEGLKQRFAPKAASAPAR